MSLVSFLLDTDWVIDHLNGVEAVTGRLREHHPRGLALSIVSVAELWEGAVYSTAPERGRRILEDFFSGILILGVDQEICRRFGEIRGALRRQGKLIGDFDLLIASTALHYDLTLLTNNRRHFESVAGLQIESLPR